MIDRDAIEPDKADVLLHLMSLQQVAHQFEQVNIYKAILNATAAIIREAIAVELKIADDNFAQQPGTANAGQDQFDNWMPVLAVIA